MSDSDTGDVDFTKEIHSIGYFINDRERMIEEMFSVLKGKKLQRILPTILKNSTVEELKADCLVHLLGMSKKRIFSILEGRDLNSSSDSETEDEYPAKEQQRLDSDNETLEINLSKSDTNFIIGKEENQHRTKKRKLQVKNDKKLKKSNSPPIVISDDECVDVKPLKKEKQTILKLRKERRALKAKIEKKMKKTEKRKRNSKIEIIPDSNDEQEEVVKSESSHDNDDVVEDKGKSLLEILELEMRARAIRALLKNTPNLEEPIPVSILNIKPEPDSKVETEINKTIAEVMNEESLPNKERDLSSPIDDVEISEVCDILTVTIDDDDDEIESIIIKDQNKEEQTKLTDQENIKTSIKSVEETVKTTTKSANMNNEIQTSNSDLNENSVMWSDRWIEKKGVKEVIKNSKLCANIRKRMRFARMLKQKQSQEEQVQENEKNNLQKEILSSLSNVEESSVAQYNLIKSLDQFKCNNEQELVNEEPESEIQKEKNIEDNTGNNILSLQNVIEKTVAYKSNSCEINEN